MPIQEATKKANQIALKNINDYKIPMESAKGKINSAIIKYNNRIEQERKAEEDRLTKEAEDKERAKIKDDLQEVGYTEKESIKEAEQVKIFTPIIIIKEDPKPEGLHFRKKWGFILVDIKKVPAKYKKEIPDDPKIMDVIKSMGENTNIPGIKVVCEKIPVTRF